MRIMRWVQLAQDRVRWKQLATAGRAIKPKPKQKPGQLHGRGIGIINGARRAAHEAALPIAPAGVPAYQSAPFNHWYDHQPGWVHGIAVAAIYARLIARCLELQPDA